MADLEQEARYREHLAEQADVQRDTVTDCSEEVNSGEVKVRGAWTERRLFEHIHGRAALREAEDMRRQDWRANDAVALNSYARAAPTDGYSHANATYTNTTNTNANGCTSAYIHTSGT